MQRIISFLASLGITAAEKASRSVLKGIAPTEWDRQLNPGMIYHIPSSEIPFVKLLIVKEYPVEEKGVECNKVPADGKPGNLPVEI